jgi:hypothetical protein
VIHLRCALFECLIKHMGYAAGGAMVEALRYKPEGRGIDNQLVSLEFFIDIILPAALRP